MEHRALVAYERTDGQYTLHYSHWGAANLKLKHRISAGSPFRGDDTDSKWVKQLLAELADGLEADAVDGYLAGEDRPFWFSWSGPGVESDLLPFRAILLRLSRFDRTVLTSN